MSEHAASQYLFIRKNIVHQFLKKQALLLNKIFLYKKEDSFRCPLCFCLAASCSHRGKPPTTIGAEELNGRVRDGNGCDLFAVATRLCMEQNCSFKTG